MPAAHFPRQHVAAQVEALRHALRLVSMNDLLSESCRKYPHNASALSVEYPMSAYIVGNVEIRQAFFGSRRERKIERLERAVPPIGRLL